MKVNHCILFRFGCCNFDLMYRPILYACHFIFNWTDICLIPWLRRFNLEHSMSFMNLFGCRWIIITRLNYISRFVWDSEIKPKMLLAIFNRKTRSFVVKKSKVALRFWFYTPSFDQRIVVTRTYFCSSHSGEFVDLTGHSWFSVFMNCCHFF